MKLQIKTEYATMEFELTHDQALSVLSLAIKLSNGETADPETTAPPQTTVAETKTEQPTKAETQPTAPPSKNPAKRSRVETFFGDRSRWNMPAADPEQKADSRPREGQEGYKGFLYIECEDCGKVKGFCAKQHIRFHKCECGHKNYLIDLRAAHVKCKCGATFTYNTNIQRDDFTIDCLTCGAPVDMTLGARKTAFVTVGELRGGGGNE